MIHVVVPPLTILPTVLVTQNQVGFNYDTTTGRQSKGNRADAWADILGNYLANYLIASLRFRLVQSQVSCSNQGSCRRPMARKEGDSQRQADRPVTQGLGLLTQALGPLGGNLQRCSREDEKEFIS